MRLLVVEDDRRVAGFIEMGLREEGYAVDVAKDGEEGGLLARVNAYDAIVLDLMLPRKSGLQLALELRGEGRTTPILMLTALNTPEDVIRGLDAGADDYLCKPFEFEVLLARLRALVRRGGAARLDELSYSCLTLDRRKHEAYASGEPLDLTPREFQLLEHFMLKPEAVVRRTELLEKVWDLRFDPDTNIVDAHISNLRRKLREGGCDGVIQTIRGVGFCLKAPMGPDGRRASGPQP
jgi:DNA-binding response OmpR family regulator